MTLVLLMESGTAGVPTNASVRQFVETESKRMERNVTLEDTMVNIIAGAQKIVSSAVTVVMES